MEEMKEIQEIMQSHRMMHINKCAVCDEDDIIPWYRVNGWVLRKCSRCGFIFLDPRPERSYYKNLYDPLSQYEYLVDGVHYIEKEKDFIDAYNNWLSDIEKMISKGRLLEIGSALGYFLEAARRRGWEVYGVEVSSGGVRHCKERYGIDAFCGEIKEAGIPSGYFDCIVILHTLEHVYDPMEVISECYRVLRPGGLLVIEIPYLKSVDDRGSNVLDDIPMHLNFFTVETLEMLLNRAGFVCLEIAKGENLQVYAKRAVNSQSINDKSKAVSVYERMLSTGEEFFKKGLYFESLRMFNIMKDLFENDVAVLNNIGAVLWAIGEQEQAMGIIEHALKIDCRYWDGLINLIHMRKQAGHHSIVRSYVKPFTDDHPDSVWSRRLHEAAVA